jgi:hypothetical protein
MSQLAACCLLSALYNAGASWVQLAQVWLLICIIYAGALIEGGVK